MEIFLFQKKISVSLALRFSLHSSLKHNIKPIYHNIKPIYQDFLFLASSPLLEISVLEGVDTAVPESSPSSAKK